MAACTSAFRGSLGLLGLSSGAAFCRFIGRRLAVLAAASTAARSYIPYPDVQKEGIKRLSAKEPAFVLYSFADIQDAQMAQDAVKADAYCIQLVPYNLLTKELCLLALQNKDADIKVLGFIPERFQTPEIKRIAEEKFRNNPAQNTVIKNEQSTPKKGIGI